MFRVRCPKCTSFNVSLHRERNAWGVTPTQGGIAVLHCGTCGRRLYGEFAESEVDKQYQEWRATSNVEIPPEKTVSYIDPQVQKAQTEAIKLVAYADGMLKQAEALRKVEKVSGLEVEYTFNSIKAEIASIRQMYADLLQQTSQKDIQQRLSSIRKSLKQLPNQIETLRLRAKEEAARRAAVQVKVEASSSKGVNLTTMNLSDLRKYATHVLKVERASKIPGGKPVLLEICREAIKKQSQP